MCSLTGMVGLSPGLEPEVLIIQLMVIQTAFKVIGGPVADNIKFSLDSQIFISRELYRKINIHCMTFCCLRYRVMPSQFLKHTLPALSSRSQTELSQILLLNGQLLT